MSRYQHTKGQIKIMPSRHCFMTRYSGNALRKTRKGKEAISEKEKYAVRSDREASGKKVNHFFTTGFLLSVA
ncbi:Alternative ribosome-rescue factor A [Raoultella terrigena]|uniref:Alternative ribosome-rescue factor A n=1 Tax=Raoultella terrigena TaxID=577 RepID=A0A4U9D4E2_RAOTE|nr:Alternative ribosome-rescue factor A [Raoultella terrigena]